MYRVPSRRNTTCRKTGIFAYFKPICHSGLQKGNDTCTQKGYIGDNIVNIVVKFVLEIRAEDS